MLTIRKGEVMLIIPAIDLLGGKVVRLLKGDYNNVTVYSNDPVATAAEFEKAGAKLIHIVDLDRARGGSSVNRDIIRTVRESTSCAVETGGGIRSQLEIEEVLEAGVKRIVIGTALVKEPQAVAAWIARYDFYPVAGLDARDGRIRVQGWTDDSGLKDTELAERCREMGFREIVYTNIAVDGTLAGPDIAGTNAVAGAAEIPVILSGGIGSPEDVARVAAASGPLVHGVIIGKAWYEKKVDLADMVRRFQTAADSPLPKTM
jgi:phosphoribosylformimino-5-aminoimidazole carboxamide ribotide isomerase